MPEAASALPLIIIPDCNVLIHARVSRDLPWEEWGPRPIEILIVGPVIAELDAVKRGEIYPDRYTIDLRGRPRSGMPAWKRRSGR